MLIKEHKSLIALLIVLCSAGGAALGGYQYDPADFAAGLIEYVPGAGITKDRVSSEPYDDPNAALGRPTVDTTGDDWPHPPSDALAVVPVYPAFRSFEIVTVGYGGRLTVRFDRKVRDNPYNPLGVDLVIFGNALQIIDASSVWDAKTDPDETVVDGDVGVEPGVVSVSQDGQTWYPFDNGPYADDFAPTLGRIYDAQDPDPALGEWNLWWGQATNPTYPLDPSLRPQLAGKTLGWIARQYGTSAGGTGFDVGAFDLPVDVETGMKWIQYVRVEPGSIVDLPEIDALADVFARRPGDANLDGLVNVGDLGLLGAHYGQASGMDWARGDFTGDGMVNVADLGVLGANYGQTNGEFGLGGLGAPAVPEPATIVLLALGGLAVRRRRWGGSPCPTRR